MKSYHFFLKDLFDTGMGTVEPDVRTGYGSPYTDGGLRERVPLNAVNSPVLVHYLLT